MTSSVHPTGNPDCRFHGSEFKPVLVPPDSYLPPSVLSTCPDMLSPSVVLSTPGQREGWSSLKRRVKARNWGSSRSTQKRATSPSFSAPSFTEPDVPKSRACGASGLSWFRTTSPLPAGAPLTSHHSPSVFQKPNFFGHYFHLLFPSSHFLFLWLIIFSVRW